MPEISIIVPVYKVEPYLRRCVDSILAQTFTDFELILADDGSPDNCPAICDEYARRDSRIHVIHQENGGLSAARNAGIDWAFANSDSQWLTFVDSDDWVYPEMLERLYRAAVELDASVSVCGYVRTHGEEPKPDVSQLQPQVWAPEIFYVGKEVNAIVAWGKLYRKECFAELRYPVGKSHEDEFLTHRVLCKAERVAYLPAAMYFYYQNDQGIMGSPFSLKRLDALEAIREQYIFFRDNYSDDLAKKMAVKYISCLNSHIKLCVRSSASRHDEFHKAAVSLKQELKQFLKDHPELKVQDCYYAFKAIWPVSSFCKYSFYRLRTEGLRGAAGVVQRKINGTFRKSRE